MERLVEGRAMWRKTAFLVAAAAMLTCAVCHPPKLHRVGGAAGWTRDVNYTQWEAHDQFYVGDWLYFVFDKRYFNVLEVNKTNYEQCNDQNFITNITRGGRDVFNLTQAKPYYFLSSGGYCFNGMKLAINVQNYISPPAPAPAKNGGGYSHTGCCQSQIIILFFVLQITLLALWASF
ncbi:lamin-like protein [Diospyros lotus]|uniref:lamin-like protein n=1 Tax=Diospyros lotus TaxID=55363 RepID=UPI0022590851|nr:lamin-like protein [Diospyros lotus]